VLVQGSSQRAVQVVVRKRVKAPSKAAAQALLNAVAITSRTQQDWTYVTLTESGRPVTTLDVEIHAPKSSRQLQIETLSGNLEVYDMDGLVQVGTGGGTIQMDRIGGDVTARTGGGDIELGRIDGSARCLSAGGSIRVASVGGALRLETGGGDIQVRETGGEVRASTAGGNIRVDRAAAAVFAHTAGGRIDVQEAGGLVTAGNSGGSIRVGAANGVQCESAGGLIRLRGTSGAMRAFTDAGSILAELASQVPIEDSILSTGGGDITVLIPSNIALTVMALNDSIRSGRIVSEFGEIPVRQVNLPNRRGTLAEGSLNGGGPMLRISASGGTIHLRRQD
ncbi:MAG: hypothetical protein ACRD7E_23840, partial [Bryobacteraceae bacterium]